MEPISNIGHERPFIWAGYVADVLHIQQVRYSNLLRGASECKLHVPPVIILIQSVKVNQVRPMDIQTRAECQSIVPA